MVRNNLSDQENGGVFGAYSASPQFTKDQIKPGTFFNFGPHVPIRGGAELQGMLFPPAAMPGHPRNIGSWLSADATTSSVLAKAVGANPC